MVLLEACAIDWVLPRFSGRGDKGKPEHSDFKFKAVILILSSFLFTNLFIDDVNFFICYFI